MSSGAAFALTTANMLFWYSYIHRLPRGLDRKSLLSLSYRARDYKDLQTKIMIQSASWQRYVYPMFFIGSLSLICSAVSIFYVGQLGLKQSSFAQGALVAVTVSGIALSAVCTRLFYLEFTLYRRSHYDNATAYKLRQSLFRLAFRTWITLTIYRVAILDGSMFWLVDLLHTKILPVISHAWSLAWTLVATNLISWIMSGLVGNTAFKVANSMASRLAGKKAKRKGYS